MRRSPFDRFAGLIARHVARAWFFCASVLVVVFWLPSLPLIGDVDTWQLIINTVTTIVTFLLVALLQNTQKQHEDRVTAILRRIEKAVGADQESQIVLREISEAAKKKFEALMTTHWLAAEEAGDAKPQG